MDIGGKPMLRHVLDRLDQAATLDGIVVATGLSPLDDAIADACQDWMVPYYRGSDYDVLARILGAAREYDATIVVRVTADCPLIDPDVLDDCVQPLLDSNSNQDWDLVLNRLPPPGKRTFPIGLDVEACRRDALEKAAAESVAPHQREHVMPYIYENSTLFERRDTNTEVSSSSGTGRFSVLLLHLEENLGNLRWTVDTSEDLDAVRTLYATVASQPGFRWHDLLETVRANPQIALSNSGAQQREFRHVDSRSSNAPMRAQDVEPGET